MFYLLSKEAQIISYAYCSTWNIKHQDIINFQKYTSCIKLILTTKIILSVFLAKAVDKSVQNYV